MIPSPIRLPDGLMPGRQQAPPRTKAGTFASPARQPQCPAEAVVRRDRLSACRAKASELLSTPAPPPCNRRRAGLSRQRGGSHPCRRQAYPTASCDPVRLQARSRKQSSQVGRRDCRFAAVGAVTIPRGISRTQRPRASSAEVRVSRGPARVMPRMHSSARAERDDRLRVKAIVGSVKPDDPSRQRSGSRARSCLQRSSKQSQKSIDLERGFDVVGSGADRRPKSRRRRRFPASAARITAARRYPVAWKGEAGCTVVSPCRNDRANDLGVEE